MDKKIFIEKFANEFPKTPSSEFHINLAGYIDVYRGYMGLDKSTHFWTSDLSKNGVPIAWYFHPDKGINREVFVSKFYEFYVRCIKE